MSGEKNIIYNNILSFCQYFFTFVLVLNMVSLDMFDVIYPEPMEILRNLKYLKNFETFGTFWKFQLFLENFESFSFFFGKFRIKVSKVGGKLWRREGYICWKYFQVRWKTIFPVFFSSISIFGENISKPDGKIIFPVFLQVPSSLFASLGKPWLIMESVWQTDDEDAHDDQQWVALNFSLLWRKALILMLSKHLKGQLWPRVGDEKWALSQSRGNRPRSAARRAAQDLV